MYEANAGLHQNQLWLTRGGKLVTGFCCLRFEFHVTDFSYMLHCVLLQLLV
jgi:hypothetical protein